MSLPIEWVEKLFAKLTLNYGVDFLNRYKGIPLVDVKTDWSEELGGFGGERIAFALKNLPDRPPTSSQFRNLCLQAPAAEVPALPEPKADPERLKRELEKLAPLRAPAAHVDCKQWARVILESQKGRTPTVIQMAKNALSMEVA